MFSTRPLFLLRARAFVSASLLTAAVVAQPLFAQDGRTVYPANSADVSYSELDTWPDFRGIWQPMFGQVEGGEPRLKGRYKEFYEGEMAKVAANPFYEIPERSNNCEPPGMPYMMTMPYSLEFLFTPGKIVVVQEAQMQIRRIYLDGRPFPDEPDPSYFGDSRARWEGSTLAVETRNTRPGLRLGIRGIVNSDELVIHERLYLDENNPDILHLDFTYVDPQVLEAPWEQKHRFRRDRTWEILEYVCDENDRHPVGEDGQSSAILPD